MQPSADLTKHFNQCFFHYTINALSEALFKHFPLFHMWHLRWFVFDMFCNWQSNTPFRCLCFKVLVWSDCSYTGCPPVTDSLDFGFSFTHTQVHINGQSRFVGTKWGWLDWISQGMSFWKWGVCECEWGDVGWNGVAFISLDSPLLKMCELICICMCDSCVEGLIRLGLTTANNRWCLE